jgi:hypothetical protein
MSKSFRELEWVVDREGTLAGVAHLPWLPPAGIYRVKLNKPGEHYFVDSGIMAAHRYAKIL